MSFRRIDKSACWPRIVLVSLLSLVAVLSAASADYRSLGYLYLSPLPGAEYTSPQTEYILVRFQNISPSSITNLSQSIQVFGAVTGNHPGQTKIAQDGRTVIFDMPTSYPFQAYELITVSLNPQLALGTTGSVSAFQYQFAVAGTMTNLYGSSLPQNGTISARGDNPPNETKQKAFDGVIGTKWLDFIAPNGSGNFSWIQYVYPTNDSHIAVQYSLISANDVPDRDPTDWQFYGVDGASNQTLLDTRSNQVFASRFQPQSYAISNTNSYRGYRLVITRIINPAAGCVQLAEISWLEPGINATITARGDNPPNETSYQAFDGTTATKWLDPIDPNGSSNFSWIQYSYPGIQTRMVNQYSISSANDFPERDPADWRFYGVDGANNLTLLDTRTNQSFASRFQTQSYAISNTNAYRGYRLQVTRVANSSLATSVQLSELSFSPASGAAQVLPGKTQLQPAASAILTASKGVAGIMPNGVSVPSDFSWVTITTNNNPDPDPIFMDNRGGGGHGYNIIFDNNGSPIWYLRVPDEHRDMKAQPNGQMTMLARDGGLHFNVFDTHYNLITNHWAVNGYSTDDHELQMLPDGSYFLIGMSSEVVDMTRFVANGSPGASVTEEIIQGFTAAGELIFQFRAWDYFDIRDQAAFINLTGNGFDFPHMNAVDIDTDGNILLSSRSTSEITKINRDTGDIIWRMGGGHGQFTFVNDPLNGPRNQHAIRMTSTNHYTLFDNGNLHSPSVSRGVEYVINTNNMTATLVWQYPPTPTTSLYSVYMGNVQRLTNGNTLINWAIGSLPKLTEVRPDGSKAFEMNWTDQWETYRVWRCPWQGSAVQPYLIVETYPDNVTLIYNQFGDTNVAFYRIYGGTTLHPTNLLATSGVTLKQLNNLQNGSNYYFRVTAVNRQGVEGQYSNETNAIVNIIKPGQNMVQNGAFSLGTAPWVWTLNGGATAAWVIESGVSHIYITNATATLANIQLKQTGMPIIKGKKYVFEFDAWATGTRYIQAMVAQDASPNLNYSGTTSTYLTPAHTHYRYVFTMNAATDFSASIFFNVGSATAGVYVDNVSLFNAPPGDINADGRVDLSDLKLLSGDWLKQQSGLSTDLDGNGKIDFNDFSTLGENWSGSN